MLMFEACCVLVIAITLAVLARGQGLRRVLIDYGALAAAAWVGEETCVSLYRFYRYADGWHLHLLDVPILVPLIWPLVILSARQVVLALWKGRMQALLIGAAVAFDASLIEVLSVRAGMWSWAEPGHLSVPVIGILGWGYFAAAAAWMLDRPGLRARLALVVVAPAIAHATILATWWGLFRWTVRGDLGRASLIGMAFVSGAVTAAVLRARSKGRAMTMQAAFPRLAATCLFVVLFLSTAARDTALWIHLGCVAIPYLAAMSLRAGSSRASQGAISP